LLLSLFVIIFIMLTFEELNSIRTLIEFHDDWDECKEIWGFDLETLYNKVISQMEYATSG